MASRLSRLCLYFFLSRPHPAIKTSTKFVLTVQLLARALDGCCSCPQAMRLCIGSEGHVRCRHAMPIAYLQPGGRRCEGCHPLGHKTYAKRRQSTGYSYLYNLQLAQIEARINARCKQVSMPRRSCHRWSTCM